MEILTPEEEILINNKNKKQVTEKQFYEKICPLNVTVTPLGNYPYITVFKLKDFNSSVVGFNMGISYFLL